MKIRFVESKRTFLFCDLSTRSVGSATHALVLRRVPDDDILLLRESVRVVVSQITRFMNTPNK